jgi:hypothetical protein
MPGHAPGICFGAFSRKAGTGFPKENATRREQSAVRRLIVADDRTP